LADPHQVNTIIAAAILDCRKDHPEGGLDPEEAKTMAKCIIQQLSEAGFQIGCIVEAWPDVGVAAAPSPAHK
jgi:hypothetical protein